MDLFKAKVECSFIIFKNFILISFLLINFIKFHPFSLQFIQFSYSILTHHF
jgi:hypothetical protein